ncbi:MAG: polyphenol oxidase family protein [Coriobacteriales bacterium]|nr:polyphenol oxidase family protein [Coriobacteriales bacterium]
MVAPVLVRRTSHGVTLLGDPHRPGGVTLAFTERTGGCSTNEFSSLNLGLYCDDNEDDVLRNQQKALDAMGAGHLFDRLVNPVQVHGSDVVRIGRGGLSWEAARQVALKGADAIVCNEPNVPVLLCYADCVPVVLVAPGAFAVVHSGWRGSLARIAGKALGVLTDAAQCQASEVQAYVGPHIGAEDYQVSEDLASKFCKEFGNTVVVGKRNLDLAAAVGRALVDEGLPEQALTVVGESTTRNTDRFYSYRAEGGKCGRHGALACILSSNVDQGH